MSFAPSAERSLSDLVTCSFAAMSAVSAVAIGALGAAYVLAQLCASVYFFHGAWALRRALRDVLVVAGPADDDSRARALLSVSLRRMSFWLAVSGLCMVALCVGGVFMSMQYPGASIRSIFFARCVMAFGRFGSSLAQVRPLIGRALNSQLLSLSLFPGSGGGV
jgi:hypothetical protein